MTKQIVRFTGYRISKVLEKPWVIIPPGQDSTSCYVEHFNQGKDGSSKRWDAISKALLLAADEAGRYSKHKRSVLGEYLESLASLPMQPELEGVQKPGSAHSGVIDVVISWAKGTKANAAEEYLNRPTLAKVNGCNSVEHIDMTEDAAGKITMAPNPSPDQIPLTPPNKVTPRVSSSGKSKDIIKLRADAASYPSPTSLARTPPTPTISSTNIGRSATKGSYLTATSSRKYTRSASIAEPEPEVKHSKTTVEQEIALIQQEAQKEVNRSIQDPRADHRPSFLSGRGRTGSSVNMRDSSTDASSSLESVSLVEVKDKDYVLVDEASSKASVSPIEGKNESSAPKPKIRLKLKMSPRTPTTRTDTRLSSSSKKRLEAIAPASLSRKTPESVVRQTPSAGAAGAPLDAEFMVPELSKDCVITYAAPGLVRNVAAARKTVIHEEGSVIMGVRFLVG